MENKQTNKTMNLCLVSEDLFGVGDLSWVACGAHGMSDK